LRSIHTPKIDAAYWLAIVLASIAGTNLGDLYADRSGLGIFGGLWLLVALAAAVFVAERRDRRAHELWFWLVILIIRTGATNIADGTAHLWLARPDLSALTAVLLAVAAGFSRWAEPGRSLKADAPFWLAMLAAGVFGTAAGDVAQHLLGDWQACCVLGAALAGAVALWVRVRSLAAYWLAVALARTAGTAIGDVLAEGAVDIGIIASTALSLPLFALVAGWGQRRRALAAAA